MLALAGCSLLLSACSEPVHVSSSGDDGDCVSHYVEIAQAASLSSLKAELRKDVRPTVRSVVIVRKKPDGKRVVMLRNAKGSTVMVVEVWTRPNGSWVAAQWSQCIDS